MEKYELRLKKVVSSLNIPTIKETSSKSYIIVDGFLNTAHNALANLALAIAINEIYGYNAAYLCNSRDDASCCHTLYESAGIEPIEIMPSFFNSRLNGLKNIIPHLTGIWRKNKDIIEDCKYDKIIKNTVIRRNKETYSLDQAGKWSVLKEIGRSKHISDSINSKMKSIDIKFSSFSHKVYSQFGIPSLTSLSNQATHISRKRSYMKKISNVKEFYQDDFYIKKEDIDTIIRSVGKEKLKKYKKQRENAKVDNINVKDAYGDRLGENNLSNDADGIKKPVALIACHAFSDAPHRDRDMAYSDYFQWAVNTMQVASSVPRVEWFVRPHPSAYMYGEQGVVESLAEEYKNINLLSGKINIKDILECVDTVVTVRGSVGMEALTYDCNVLAAGNSIYESLDNVTMSLNPDEYEELLKNISKPSGVKNKTKLRALALLYYRDKSISITSDILCEEIEPGKSRNESLMSNLEKIRNTLKGVTPSDYKDDEYYKKLVRFIEHDKRLSIMDFN